MLLGALPAELFSGFFRCYVPAGTDLSRRPDSKAELVRFVIEDDKLTDRSDIMGGISVWQLLIVLGIVIVLFGTKRLRNIGGDLGSAIKGFKKAVVDEDKPQTGDTQKVLASDRHGASKDVA